MTACDATRFRTASPTTPQWWKKAHEVSSGEGRLERTVPIVFSVSGETFDVGVDTGAPVGPYRHGFECTAEIHGVTLERFDEPSRSTRDQMRAGEHAAGLRAQ